MNHFGSYQRSSVDGLSKALMLYGLVLKNFLTMIVETITYTEL